MQVIRITLEELTDLRYFRHLGFSPIEFIWGGVRPSADLIQQDTAEAL
jgi:hypothetical protein